MALIYVAINPDLFAEIGFEDHLADLRAVGEVEVWQGPGNPPLEVVLDAVQRAEVLVTGWGTPSLLAALRDWSLERSPLRLVAHTAGSIKHLVPVEALQRGLQVTTANDSLAEAVAEFTLGAILAARRQIVLAAERFKAGKPRLSYRTMRELPGSVVGIIGASAIGRRVIDLLRPWNVQILLYDPYVSAETAAVYNAQPVDLLTLMQASDIVSLHAPVTPETLLMLRGEHFAAMKDGALFVNTARGRLVDAEGLLAALQTGRIWAVLDVTDPNEPLPPDSPFFQLENCVVLPHIAGHSVEARLRMGQYTAEDILRHLAGEPLLRAVPAGRFAQLA
jgi:phosphoglycerate dehydrogenase-like enzyme